MVILDKYHGSEEENDAPPSYDTITTVPGTSIDEKSPSQPSTPRSSRPISQASNSNPSSWGSMLSSSTPSSRTSKQVRQTVFALVRDLVFNVDSPDLLRSCADACRAHGLDISAILQERCIEHHSALYWGVLNHRDTLLSSLLVHAAPLSRSTISEIRLACLATSNQDLFQALRCQREPFPKNLTPLSKSPGTDALVLGSLPADVISIREDGEGAFVAEMQINLWQKRMRVSGRVSVEFIARGRIWSLTFFSSPSTSHTAVGVWQVALSLQEHSPPTFIDSGLVIDMPPANASCPSDLISLSPTPDESTPGISPPASPTPAPSNRFRSKPKVPQNIEVRLKSAYRLAYRSSNMFLAALDAAFASPVEWSPPCAEVWIDKDGTQYTTAIVVPLDGGSGGELLCGNTSFVGADGTLYARLEARLSKPDTTECVIC